MEENGKVNKYLKPLRSRRMQGGEKLGGRVDGGITISCDILCVTGQCT